MHTHHGDRRHGVTLLVCLLIMISVAPIHVRGQDATPTTKRIELPAPTGPHAVGRTSFDWADSSRVELFTDDPADVRELAVWVWYPAAPAATSEPAAYLPGEWGAVLGPVLGFDPSRVAAHSVESAPLAGEPASYPVLIFSPGSGFFAAAYAALAEELASHGYIVVGVNHPYNANVTVFADGRVILGVPDAQPLPPDVDGQGGTGDTITEIHAADLQFVLDQLERLNDEAGPFQGRLDRSRIGLVGHSLGGAAAAEACRVDRRCDAAVDMDGALWGEAAATGLPVPFLLLMAEQPSCRELAASGLTTIEECETAQAVLTPTWETAHQAARPGYWLTVAGSRHGSFSDLPFLPLPSELADPLLGGATIVPARMWRVTNDYLLAFFDRHLNGVPSPLLDGPSPAYPEVEFVPGGA
jgi:predicted dienelactone hydrolase